LPPGGTGHVSFFARPARAACEIARGQREFSARSLAHSPASHL